MNCKQSLSLLFYSTTHNLPFPIQCSGSKVVYFDLHLFKAKGLPTFSRMGLPTRKCMCQVIAK